MALPARSRVRQRGSKQQSLGVCGAMVRAMHPAAAIRFAATLLQPAAPADVTWLFLLLQRRATRSMVSVAGTVAGTRCRRRCSRTGGAGIGSRSNAPCSRQPVCRLDRRWRSRWRSLPKNPRAARVDLLGGVRQKGPNAEQAHRHRMRHAGLGQAACVLFRSLGQGPPRAGGTHVKSGLKQAARCASCRHL
ncbi:hypothetical protein XFF6990_90019 [Xanthomonas citri pv. fuscans]|uniref:Uncharacterized protein n=1 Tax=Xanthomonas campestris pv. phaseoli TaxID=317013 RepID=A0A7Z7IWS8_XANCH|nr:hypothetical protein XFF6990_90019 [Xanthomonas citri pv. fuscans]SOO23042.1 hypothetical protein XFF6991_180153 [Xanthomonas phaseoli pv. phaseoli]